MSIKKYIATLKKNIKYLIKNDLSEKENDIIFRAKDESIEDLFYELDENKNFLKSLTILDEWETFDLLENKPKSFCRLGDGEIYLMKGIDQSFQKYNEDLANRLKAILKNNRDDIYVGINRAYFHSPICYAEKNRRFYRLYGTALRRFFIENCSSDNVYFDAGFLTAYFRFGDAYPYEEHYKRVKKLFQGKKILLVAGDGIFEKLQYNVFDEADKFEVIHGPKKDAYSSLPIIINEILENYDTSWVVCAILGMTAKVLVIELTNMGYMAWDVGHVAKDYDAYKREVEKNPEQSKQFWDPD